MTLLMFSICTILYAVSINTLIQRKMYLPYCWVYCYIFLLVLYRQQLLVTPAILVILNIRRLSQDSFYDIYLIPSWDRRVLAEISPDTECHRDVTGTCTCSNTEIPC